jgi:tetratricopeptide (TPR) repeat protein
MLVSTSNIPGWFGPARHSASRMTTLVRSGNTTKRSRWARRRRARFPCCLPTEQAHYGIWAGRPEALAEQNRAVEADHNAFALWARAETLRKLKRYADSLRDYDAALRIAPDDAPAHAGRGIDLWRLGKIQEAQRVFDRAVALKADRYTLMRRAEFLIGQRKLKDAISDYSKVIALDPSYFPARVNRGNALAELGDYDKALDDYNVALRMHKNDAVTYRGRGWVFERQGRMDRARADYRRALELAPNDRWLQNALKKLPQ